MSKTLTKMSLGGKQRWWSELVGDAVSDSLRLVVMGWLPEKRERLARRSGGDAVCVLLKGKGVFRGEGDDAPAEVCGPSLIFVSAGTYSDYGPVNESRWDEFFWSLDGPRIAEWKRFGWWPSRPCCRPMEPAAVADARDLFLAGADALERRDGRALDLHKLRLERWLCEQAWRPRVASPIEAVVETWRREPWRDWSLRAAAAGLGQSYTTFRVGFLRHYGTSPYDYLLRLRMELAANLLRGTSDPVKSVALRCGFKHVETFLRAFARVHGASPKRWRMGGTVGGGDYKPGPAGG